MSRFLPDVFARKRMPGGFSCGIFSSLIDLAGWDLRCATNLRWITGVIRVVVGTIDVDVVHVPS